MTGKRQVLVVPATEAGRGGGHLARSADLVAGLREKGVEAYLFIGSSDDRRQAELRSALVDFTTAFLYAGDPRREAWTFVVLDRFRTDAKEFDRWVECGPVVGIDEGGPSRRSFDYLMDLLPGLPGRSPANLEDPALLPLPERRRASFVRAESALPIRVLVSFGAEDPAGLTGPAVRSLAAIPGLAVDALLGPLVAETRRPEESAMLDSGARVLHSIPNLKGRLADYDLVVTSFGLTAFESARARVPVLLVSPTRYHEKLSRARGFASVGVGKRAASRAGPFILAQRRGFPPDTVSVRLRLNLELLAERTAAAAPRERDPNLSDDLASQLSAFTFPGSGRCPLCGSRAAAGSRALARFSDRTYRRCATCGMLHMIRPVPPAIVYARDYFFEDYKKQYGRTYLEDFPQLEAAGAARVRRIKGLLRSGESVSGAPRILDIGCAYGPFLAAAKAAGFSPFGVDPAEDAVRFVREKLGLDAAVGSFPIFDPVAAFGGQTFDAVTFWYVIEHFPVLGEVLAGASAALKKGGVLALSTPSGAGISARARSDDFLMKSPADHWTIWEPSRTAAFLARFGFELVKVHVTGHHPERFPGLADARIEGLPCRLADRASRIFGLGDTFEAYAVKK